MTIALILSGGTGRRLGASLPKQYIQVGGKPIFLYSIETLFHHEKIDAVQIVADASWQGFIEGWMKELDGPKKAIWGQGTDSQEAGIPKEADSRKETVCQLASPKEADGSKKVANQEETVCREEPGSLKRAAGAKEADGPKEPGALKRLEWRGKFRGFTAPGETRQLSIRNGLEDISSYAGDEDYVFIHDAARPLLPPDLITRCVEGVQGHDGLMPVLPMKDTIYSSLDRGRSVTALLDRRTLYAGQAPEIFRFGRYLEANRKLLPDQIRQINGSTEPAILSGMDVVMIPGEEGNFKITTEADLERFRRIVEGKVTAGE